MTHRQIYEQAKKAARKHKKLCDLLGEIEVKKFGFEFSETDSDRIIDSVNYGTDDLIFDKYLAEMRFYKKSFDKTGAVKSGGIYSGNDFIQH